jgi:hypothetical protein
MARAINVSNLLRFRFTAWRYGRSDPSYGAHVTGAVVGLLLLGSPATSRASGSCPGIAASWRGTWEVTVDYIDRKTGALVATDVTTAAICPGMPIKPPLLSTLSSFTEHGGDRGLNVAYRAKHTPQRGCNVFVEVAFHSVRNGDSWNGTGHWTATGVGNCTHFDAGEDFVVSGTRLSRSATCGFKEPSLVERFFAHNALIPFLGRSTR